MSLGFARHLLHLFRAPGFLASSWLHDSGALRAACWRGTPQCCRTRSPTSRIPMASAGSISAPRAERRLPTSRKIRFSSYRATPLSANAPSTPALWGAHSYFYNPAFINNAGGVIVQGAAPACVVGVRLPQQRYLQRPLPLRLRCGLRGHRLRDRHQQLRVRPLPQRWHLHQRGGQRHLHVHVPHRLQRDQLPEPDQLLLSQPLPERRHLRQQHAPGQLQLHLHAWLDRIHVLVLIDTWRPTPALMAAPAWMSMVSISPANARLRTPAPRAPRLSTPALRTRA